MTLSELSQLYYLQREIEADRQRLADMRAKAQSVSASKITGMPRSGSHGGLDAAAVAIADLDLLIQEKLARCLTEQYRLEEYIASIPDSLTRQIFVLRFVKGYSWQKVAWGVGGYNTEDSVKKTCYRYIRAEEKKSEA